MKSRFLKALLTSFALLMSLMIFAQNYPPPPPTGGGGACPIDGGLGILLLLTLGYGIRNKIMESRKDPENK
ncbi:MAG: hypothetical protein FJY07_05090 [Bacteroidetes bacterium]|nr:hypothetical protein [Bacteroidota bacterium]